VLGVLALVGYGLYFLPRQVELVTLLGVFTVVAYRTMPSFNRITLALLSIRSHTYTFDIVETPKTVEVEDDLPKVSPLSFDHEISFERVSFRYPQGSQPTLLNLNFSVPKGKCVGIVGRSGTGKTTLLSLLLGFLRPTEGRIAVDGTELTPSNLRAWYRLIGYVQQEVYVVDDSLRANIAFGVPEGEVDDERLKSSLKRASLNELVETLPKGLDTKLSERGTSLSVGQKQRVGIARALYAGAEVLIFDEATSSLDRQTEDEITEAIKALLADELTILIVAHRLSTLRHCDFILELDAGSIKGVRSYNEVVTQGG
jgi:ABC-type multidrug transport system fused ATPase/permease subunit